MGIDQGLAKPYKPKTNEGNSSHEEEGMMLVQEANATSESQWTLDSGCSYHYISHREWFAAIEEVKGGEVFLGDNSTCSITGIGTIKLKTKKGGVYNLTNVQHVPTMKKNLISLGGVFAEARIQLHASSW